MPITPSVSGAVICANRVAFGKILGDDLVRRAFMSDARFRFWEETSAMEWVELNLVEESIRSLATVVDMDPIALNMDATRMGAEQSFRTIWRVLLRFTTVDALVARSSVLYGRAFNVGSLSYEPQSPTQAMLRIRDWGDPPVFHMHGLSAGVEAMLRVSGRHDARVRYEPAGGQHLLRVSTRL